MQAPLPTVWHPVARPPSRPLNASGQALLCELLLHSRSLSPVLLQQKVFPLHQLERQPVQSFQSAPQKISCAKGGDQADSDNLCRRASLRTALQVRFVAIALLFGGPLAAVRALLSALPPDFSQRWRAFFEELGGNEPRSGCGTERKSCVLYDRHGEVITTVTFTSDFSVPSAGDQNANGSAIPTFLWQAVVACEDRRFFRHPGIDPRGLARALLSFSTNGGGSTITQQLAKNVFLTSERKWTRKVMEMFLALILESRMSKWDILKAYLNKIYWGHGKYGVDAAANFYFGKSIFLLNTGECAMLAGMIPAPEMFSPFHDPSRGKRAQKRALQRMVEVGFVDHNCAAAILNGPLELTSGGEMRNFSPCKAPFFVNEVLNVLIERYGYKRVSEGGLKVHTTLDLGMQDLAEKVVNESVAKIDTHQICLKELAVIQTEKKVGELQVVQDSVSKTNKNNRHSKDEMLQSSVQNLKKELKIAISASLEAALVLIDHSDGGVLVLIGGREQSESNINWSTQVYRPLGSALKPVIYLSALAETLSTVDILKDCTCNLEAKFCKESLKKITPMQLANVYSTVGSGGIFHKPYFIKRVETADGRILEENKTSGIRVVEENMIRQLKTLLQQGTQAKNLSRVRQVVVSDDSRDAWCAGFTQEMTCVVWLGCDDISCTGLHLHSGLGASQATQIWKSTMSLMRKDQAAKSMKSWHLRSAKKERRVFKVRRRVTKF